MQTLDHNRGASVSGSISIVAPYLPEIAFAFTLSDLNAIGEKDKNWL